VAGLRLPRLLRLLKIMRLLKIFRMAHIRPELMWWFQYSRHANLFKLIYLIVAMVVLVHYIACAFMLVLGDESLGSNSWMQLEECEFPSNTEIELRLLTSPPKLDCLVFRDYYNDLQTMPGIGTIHQTLDVRMKTESGFNKPAKVLFTTQAAMDVILEIHDCAAARKDDRHECILDDCFVEGDVYESCADTSQDMSYVTAFYFSMLLVMGESIGPKLIEERVRRYTHMSDDKRRSVEPFNTRALAQKLAIECSPLPHNNN